MRRGERGVSTAYFGLFFLIVGVVVGAFIVVLAYAASAHQAATAADLSALAGAQSRLDGHDACAAAQRLAAANHAQLEACTVTGDAVMVETSVPVQLRMPGLPDQAHARATAAPEAPR